MELAIEMEVELALKQARASGNAGLSLANCSRAGADWAR
jgi:hypothetical protein